MFSFIVPVKNQLDYTRALVETVQAQNPDAAVEWVIVDSGSTDGTPDYCREIGARVVPFQREVFNYCAALNAGAAVATGDLWIVSNNDIEFRSPGDLARLERIFREWPVVAVISPGRESGEAELELKDDWIYGPCWAVRPEAYRAWGGMPEALSGYGYDELWTIYRCWGRGETLAYLTGWNVFHHGSVTFGPTGGNVSPAMRRNLSRLLALFDAQDLDRGADPLPIIERLSKRERERVPAVLALSEIRGFDLHAQGYANARASREPARDAQARVYTLPSQPGSRQWVPWLANELRLQPDAPSVGAGDCVAVRRVGGGWPEGEPLAELLRSARAVGPAAPPVMPPETPPRRTLRQRLAAWLHDWRHRKTRLPVEW